MTYRPSDMAEAQAIGLCWTARFHGLPPIHSIRQAVTQLHAEECGWCVYPMPELLAMLALWQPSQFVLDKWWGLPRQTRLTAIKQAQVTE